VTTIYKAGGVKSDTPTGFRIASALVNSINRVILKDETGANFQVSAGKTFYIGIITWLAYTNRYTALMCDDDGAGTNEKIIVLLPDSLFGTDFCVLPQSIECVFGVPTGKYLTAKMQTQADGYIIVNGQEV